MCAIKNIPSAAILNINIKEYNKNDKLRLI